IVMLRSPVIPFVASSMTAVQSTAARSAGVRATAARILARYDRTIRMKPAAVGPLLPLIHVLGRVPNVAVSAFAVATAQSSHPSAASLTAREPRSGGKGSGASVGPPIAAES